MNGTLLAAVGSLVAFVDPFIGTAGTGHTFPGACVPFGLVQASPDTGNGDWEHCSGYNKNDREIWGFSQTHLNGTGCADLGDLLIQPFTSDSDQTALKERSGRLVMPSEKSDEEATPGYYAVTLKDFQVRAEVSATEHCAIYRLHFNGNETPRLLLDTQWGIGGDPTNQIKECSIERLLPECVAGNVKRSAWVDRSYGFCAAFSIPATSWRMIPPREGENGLRVVMAFNIPKGQPLVVKVGISSKSCKEAEENLKAEIPEWDFDAVKRDAAAKWEKLLSRAVVDGSDDVKRNWYTALYHFSIQPNNIADAGERPLYSTFSCWDTFRAAGPLYTILMPEMAADFVDSMLAQGRKTGYLPVWSLWGEENQCMIGTHSVPMIVDAWLKGVWRGDAEAAYAQIRDTLMRPHDERRKEDWAVYDRYGFYPYDIVTAESVSRTLECSYDDWCASVMAERLGRSADAEYFRVRSEYWRNVLDPSLGLVRGRTSSGAWRKPYDPYAFGHDHSRENDFTEGNAFQYSWHVLHDPPELFAAMGGRAAFTRKLDGLFAEGSERRGEGRSGDVTGMIGQYVHGNEPSHHVLYLYALAGRPRKAAERIREVFERFYRPEPDGLCGNEDCGQMSAWYIFSAMGFYPVNPCGGEYVIGAPQVPRATLRMPGGRTFTVEARNLSLENMYVKSAMLNGRPLEGRTLSHSDIVGGGTLVFEMSDR